MGRWQPGARGRLQQAAWELFVERGYDATTVADIAERAGLTARTFFRHYADKREVLFDGSHLLSEHVLAALTEAPPLQAVETALCAADLVISDRTWSARRAALLSTHAELQERELIKLAALVVSLADGLRALGTPDPQASLAAETGVALFKQAFEQWVVSGPDEPLSAAVRRAFADLRALAAG